MTASAARPASSSGTPMILLMLAVVLCFALALSIGMRAMDASRAAEDPAVISSTESLTALLGADQLARLRQPPLTVGDARDALSRARRTHARWQGQPSPAPAAKAQLDRVISGALAGLSARITGLPDSRSLNDQAAAIAERLELVTLAVDTYRLSLPQPGVGPDQPLLLLAGILALIGLLLLGVALVMVRRRRTAPIPGQRLITAGQQGEQLILEFDDEGAEGFADLIGTLDDTANTLAEGAGALLKAFDHQQSAIDKAHKTQTGLLEKSEKQAAEILSEQQTLQARTLEALRTQHEEAVAAWREAAEHVSKAWRYSQQKAASAWAEAGDARDSATAAAIRDMSQTLAAQSPDGQTHTLIDQARGLLADANAQFAGLTQAAATFTERLGGVDATLQSQDGAMEAVRADILRVTAALGQLQQGLGRTLSQLDGTVPGLMDHATGLGEQLAQTAQETLSLQRTLALATEQLGEQADRAEALQTRVTEALDQVQQQTQETADAQAALTSQLEALMARVGDSAQSAQDRRAAADRLIDGLEQVLGRIVAAAPRSAPVADRTEMAAVRRGLEELAQWMETSQQETAARLDLLLFTPEHARARGLSDDREIQSVIRDACAQALAPLATLAEELRTHAGAMSTSATSVQQQAETTEQLLSGAVSAVEQVSQLSERLEQSVAGLDRPLPAEARLQDLADQLATTQAALSATAGRLDGHRLDFTQLGSRLSEDVDGDRSLSETVARLESVTASLDRQLTQPTLPLAPLLDAANAAQTEAATALGQEIARLSILGTQLDQEVQRLIAVPSAANAPDSQALTQLSAVASTLEEVARQLSTAGPTDLAPVTDRLDALLAIQDAARIAPSPAAIDLSAITDRLDALLAAQDATTASTRELSQLAQALEALIAKPAADLDPVLASLDRLLERPAPELVDLSPVLARLEVLADRAPSLDLAPLTARLDALAAAHDLGPILSRLEALAATRPELDALSARIDSWAAAQPSATPADLAPIEARLDAVLATLDQLAGEPPAASPVDLSAVEARLDALLASVDRLATAAALTGDAMTAPSDKPSLAAEHVRAQLSELQDAVLGLHQGLLVASPPPLDPVLSERLATLPETVDQALSQIRSSVAESLAAGLAGQEGLSARLEMLADSPRRIAELTAAVNAVAAPAVAGDGDGAMADALLGIQASLAALGEQVAAALPTRAEWGAAVESLRADVADLGARISAEPPSADASSLSQAAASLSALSQALQAVGAEAEAHLAQGDVMASLSEAEQTPGEGSVDDWAGAAEAILDRARQAMERLAPFDEALPRADDPARGNGGIRG